MTGGQIGNVDLVKQLNGAVVYRLIDQQGPISRIQIADVSSLAPASVTKITRQLLERGLIKEVAQQASTGGRRAISLTSENADFHSLAIKLGRDHITLALVDLSGFALISHDEPFEYTNQNDFLDRLKENIHQFIVKHENLFKEFIAIAIVLPGLIDSDTGIVEYMPTIDVDKLPLSAIIREEFGVKCFIGNDIRGQALAEHYFGASKNYHDSLLVSVHNGTGAGIIVNGQIFLGFNRNVGEIGHIQIDPLGKKCQCGNYGCLETIASNPALIEEAENLLSIGHPSMLQREKVDVSGICEAAMAGDELAKQLLVRLGNQLGKAIAITVNLFNPQQIIISGGITQAEDIIFPAIRRCIENQSLTIFHQNLPIVKASLSEQPSLSAFSLIKRAMLNGQLLQHLLED